MQKKKIRPPRTKKISRISRSKSAIGGALVLLWSWVIFSYSQQPSIAPQVVYGAAIKTEVVETEVTIETETELPYSEEDLYLLSHLICGEVEGCDRKMKLYVGSVVLNRVADSRFPDNLYDVIYQNNPLQYACTVDGNIEKTPGEETIEVAKYLLENGSQLPPNVIFQAEFKQGIEVYGEPLVAPNGVIMYFCIG